MKKTLLLLVAIVFAIALTSCGEKDEEVGKVLNIRVWNTEFVDRFTAYYPDYDKKNDDGSYSLKDGTKVNFIITANDNNGYQNALDTALKNQSSAAADDKVDMFLIEADYAKKYANDAFALDVVGDLGISETTLSQQYQYTKDIVTDDDGKLRAVSWQATPGLFAYRTDIAQEVLGVSEPADVQAKINTWEKFDAVAAQMSASSYNMISGYDDAYRAYSNNTSAPWVNSNSEIVVDDQIINWIKQTKNYTDNGYNNGTNLWSDQWNADMGPTGTVFGYFFSTWGINFVLSGGSLEHSDQEAKAGNGLYGDYRVVEGPASYYWGGTWLVGAKGTDNEELVADIMTKLTADQSIADSITRDTEDYTNNKAAMNAIANDSTYGSAFLGGQNHVALFNESADKIDMSNISPYDQGLNEAIQKSFKDYFLGETTWAETWAAFETSVTTTYPELSLPNVPADPFA